MQLKENSTSLEGASMKAGTMLDPLVGRYDPTGLEVLLFDDDSGTGLNALLTAEAYVMARIILLLSVVQRITFQLVLIN